MASKMSGSLSARWLFSLLVFIAMFAASAYAADGGPDLTVFFTSDTRGMLRRCGCSEGQLGGLSARAAYIKACRVEGRTLVLDAGDTLFEGFSDPDDLRKFYKLRSETIIKAMNEAGYDAAAVGEYDLAFGGDFLKCAASEARFPFLAANLSIAGKRPFASYVIKDCGGIRVGVIGVLDPEFPYGSFKDRLGAVSVSDAAGAAKAAIRDMKGRVGLIVVLAHLAIGDVEKFARALPEADVIIQGHSEDALDKPVKAGHTLIVKGFYKGKRLGKLYLWLNGNDGRIRDYKYSATQLDESLPLDPVVEGIIADYRGRLKQAAFAFNRPDPAGLRYAGSETCRPCHRREFANWSSTGHARAYSALVKTNDQYDPECLPCHTTGYGYTSGYNTRTDSASLRNVGCENCHGRGSTHASPSGGMMVKRAVPESICLPCHDEYNSPNFNYEKYKAMGGAHKPGGSR